MAEAQSSVRLVDFNDLLGSSTRKADGRIVNNPEGIGTLPSITALGNGRFTLTSQCRDALWRLLRGATATEPIRIGRHDYSPAYIRRSLFWDLQGRSHGSEEEGALIDLVTNELLEAISCDDVQQVSELLKGIRMRGIFAQVLTRASEWTHDQAKKEMFERAKQTGTLIDAMHADGEQHLLPTDTEAREGTDRVLRQGGTTQSEKT